MSEDISGRVKREQEAYDAQTLQHGTYRKVLQHGTYWPHRQRAEIQKTTLQHGHQGRILEIGSSVWRQLDRFGVFPKELYCINISEAEIKKGLIFAETSVNKPILRLMDAHQLAFDNNYFDVVFGGSILHHLNLPVALSEVRRVLKPNGKICFYEPLDNNPIGKLVRFLTPQARTVDEQPFRFQELRMLREYFDVELSYQQFLSVPSGVVSGAIFSSPDNMLTRMAFAADQRILKLAPWVGPLYRHFMIVGTPRRATK
jgi:SAM-dependent methyltransferase